MWHDIEAEIDLLNFGMVAHAAADLIRGAQGTPLTIGVSGGWGAGKSTLVKLVKADLQANGATQERRPSYVLMEFNAWLYQGYEDARQALLQSVSDRLLEEAECVRRWSTRPWSSASSCSQLGRLAALFLRMSRLAPWPQARWAPFSAPLPGWCKASATPTSVRRT